ncbi:LysM domain-containing protein [Aeromicrobium sp. REDSEA-S38_B2]|uniref:LysM peptidoglycan-binding domain-containing protein n=1 Tax=Aeromicrobium sp. REDSEA-S38_B2 TaxID=1811528 RepID=UPI00257E9DCC|nr:LysM domain-containing protein [Aeromicrobium sp. REDSEA-S38_B2]
MVRSPVLHLCWLVSVLVLLVRVPSVERTVAGLGASSFPTALTSLLELVLLTIAAWAAVALGLGLVGGRAAVVAARLLPRAVRGALVAGVVTTLSVGTAHAATSPSPDPSPAASTLDGLVLPDRPASEVHDTPPVGPPTQPPPDTVVVAPGDSLWSIAASRSGPRASVADVATSTEQWHQENREVVGPDPDLLQPGQRLTAPREPA